MATEQLAIPEQHLADFVRILRAGMAAAHDPPIYQECLDGLNEWVEGVEEHLGLEFKEEFDQ